MPAARIITVSCANDIFAWMCSYIDAEVVMLNELTGARERNVAIPSAGLVGQTIHFALPIFLNCIL